MKIGGGYKKRKKERKITIPELVPFFESGEQVEIEWHKGRGCYNSNGNLIKRGYIKSCTYFGTRCFMIVTRRRVHSGWIIGVGDIKSVHGTGRYYYGKRNDPPETW